MEEGCAAVVSPGGLRNRGSLFERLYARVGSSMGLARGHLSGLFSMGLPNGAPQRLCVGNADMCYCAKF